LAVSRLEVERDGPLHSVILVETKLAESGKASVGFYHRARIHAYANSALVEMDYFVANTDSRPAGAVEGSMPSKVMVKSITLKFKPIRGIAAAQNALGVSTDSGAVIQKTEEIAIARGDNRDSETKTHASGWGSF